MPTFRGIFRTVINVIAVSIAATLVGLPLLSNTASAQESVFSTPINPDEYVVGPGDRFRVDFWNGSTPPIEVTVTPEGFLLLSSMGRVDVGNMTLTEARTKLTELIKRFFSDNEFSVTLVGVRLVKVLVAGAVKKPGLYEGIASQRVSELIDKAGGFADGASFRNISLSGGNRDYGVDLLQYERMGDLSANPRLYSGHRISVPVVTDSSYFVHVSGEVVRPGGFEYRKGDSLGGLIALAMGFTGLQDDSALIYRETQASSVPIAQTGYSVMPGDKIVIKKKPLDPDRDFYTIVGEVVIPGSFPFREGMTLGDALRISEGQTSKADIYSLIVYRRGEYLHESTTGALLESTHPNNLSFASDRIPISFSMEEFYPKKMSDVGLLPGDSIVVPALTGSVGVYGMVNRPGLISFSASKMSVGDAVKSAGGYASSADRRKVEVLRKFSGTRIKAGRGLSLHDGDTVIVPERIEKKDFWDRIKDASLILGGVGLTALAIHNLTD